MTDALIGVIVVVCVLGWVVTTWIRAKNGYPVEDMLGFKDHKSSDNPDTIKALLQAEIARRDESIAKLEQRVRVLERIVTDRSGILSEEIERLRSEPVARPMNGPTGVSAAD